MWVREEEKATWIEEQIDRSGAESWSHAESIRNELNRDLKDGSDGLERVSSSSLQTRSKTRHMLLD